MHWDVRTAITATPGPPRPAPLVLLSFSDPDARVRAQTVERVRGHIEIAGEVGSAVTIGTLSGKLGNSADMERHSRRAQALECLAKVCEIAEGAGVTILLEPLNRYECDYINTLSDALKIVDELGARNLRLLADTFHMNIEETDLSAGLRAARLHLGHVHLADSNRQAPGHGHLNLGRILETLAGIEYRGYLSFEIFPLPDARRAIRDAIGTVQAWLGRRAAAAVV
jgi:sugar phosphate isomerase/epimerase